MIGETGQDSAPRRMTRAEQRVATHQAIIDATIGCLVDEGYAALTTRRIADRAGIAQSTVMNHFPTRDTLIVDAVLQMAMNLADDVLERIDLAALREIDHREVVLDQAWQEFSSPQALAAAQLWAAVWNEPELVKVLRRLETELSGILLDTTTALFPELADDPRLPTILDAVITLIRGVITAIPVWGTETMSARWDAFKPLLLEIASYMLDG